MVVGDGSRGKGRSLGSVSGRGRRATADGDVVDQDSVVSQLVPEVGDNPEPNEVPQLRRSSRARGRITNADNKSPSLAPVDVVDQVSVASQLVPEVGDNLVPKEVPLTRRSGRVRGRIATVDNKSSPSLAPFDAVEQDSIVSKLAPAVGDNPVPNKAPLPRRSGRAKGQIATDNKIPPPLAPVDAVDQDSIASQSAPEVGDNLAPNEAPCVPPLVNPIASPLAALAGMDTGLQAFLQSLVTQMVTEVVTQVVPLVVTQVVPLVVPQVVPLVVPLVVPQVVQAMETTIAKAPLQQPLQPESVAPPQKPPPEVPRRGFSSMLTMIAEMNPPKFEGSLEDMENWLAEMEKLFAIVGCPEEEKVSIASCYLQKDFYKWWEDSKPTNHDSTWEEFKAKLEEKYNLRALREAKLIEFLNPKLEDETVAQATVKYFHLLRYASSVVQNEKDKIRYFDMRMSSEIRLHMVGHSCTTLKEYIDRALALELIMAETDERFGTQSSKKQKTQSASGSRDSGFRRPDSAPAYSRRHPLSARDVGAPSSDVTHSGSQGPARAGCRCFNCGSEQHKRRDCLKPFRICRGCGERGHMVVFCREMNMKPSQSHASLLPSRGPVGQAHPAPPAPPQSLGNLDSVVDPKTMSPPCQSCHLEFDGASKGNPGLSGAGAVLRADDGSVVFLLREGVGIATNSVAEYRAIILGLKHALSIGFKHVRVLGDSQMVCMQIQGLRRCRKPEMAKLCKEAVDLKEKFLSFKIEHIFREFNGEADGQANQAIILRDGEVQVDCLTNLYIPDSKIS